MTRATATLVALTVSVLLPFSDASAQRGLDRALTTSRAARAEPQAPGETPDRGHFVSQRTADTLEASWILQPLGSVGGSDNEIGLRAGLLSVNRYGPWRWQLAGCGVRRYRGGTARAHWQIDGELRPPIEKLMKSLVLTVYATHASTIDVARSEELAIELDWVYETKSKTVLSLGAVGYYGWEFPEDAESSHGSVLGVLGYWEQGRFAALAEYDLSSDFAGGDSYTVAGWCRLTPKASNTQVSVRGGYEEGDVFSLRLELGLAHNRTRPAVLR